MDCDETRRWLDAHLDGELDLARDTEVAAHLHACAACAAAARQRQALREAVAEKLPRFTAPPHLAAAVRASLRAAAPPVAPAPRRLPWWSWGGALGGAAALVLAVTIGFESGVRQGRMAQFGDEVISAHVRALDSGHVMDVASSDHHTVKPWFAGKLDFAPPVPDLAAAGFPLLGGRLDRLGDQTVAGLVYQHGKHFITVFVWPASSPFQPALDGPRLGYQARAWREGDLDFAAVSDMAADEFNSFVQQMQAATR
jgi:anti-sigma factor RsiW